MGGEDGDGKGGVPGTGEVRPEGRSGPGVRGAVGVRELSNIALRMRVGRSGGRELEGTEAEGGLEAYVRVAGERAGCTTLIERQGRERSREGEGRAAGEDGR